MKSPNPFFSTYRASNWITEITRCIQEMYTMRKTIANVMGTSSDSRNKSNAGDVRRFVRILYKMRNPHCLHRTGSPPFITFRAPQSPQRYSTPRIRDKGGCTGAAAAALVVPDGAPEDIAVFSYQAPSKISQYPSLLNVHYCNTAVWSNVGGEDIKKSIFWLAGWTMVRRLASGQTKCQQNYGKTFFFVSKIG